MVRKLVCVAPLLPPGSHRVVLSTIDDDKSKLDPMQPSFVFTFSCDRGIASRITGVILRRGDALHKTVCELAGRDIKVGEYVNPPDFIGREYEIDVVAKGDRGVQIVAIRPVAAE